MTSELEDFEGDDMVRTTNDLKKGMWVLLRNGWKAEVWDNMKGNTRVCDVYGDFHEAGSVYSHDMVLWGKFSTAIHYPIKHTEAQLKLKDKVEAMGM